MTGAHTPGDGAPPARTLIGAAAAGAPAGNDPPPAPAPPDPAESEFRLHAGERIADGIRRVARAQLEDGRDQLAAVSQEDLDKAIHATRKDIKRVRATLRIARDAIGEERYAAENANLRTIAGRLSATRDARVLIDTLSALHEQASPRELAPDATAQLRARLQAEHEHAAVAMVGVGEIAAHTREALAEAVDRTNALTFARHDFGALEPGLRRIYRRGRRELRAAHAEPDADALHDTRKRAKDLWHAAQLLHDAHPKRMQRLAHDAHALADLLGDHHDLSVLRDHVEAHPELFEHATSRDALLAVLDRRRDELRDSALELGRRVYKRSPKKFVARIERGWRKRVGATAQAGVAGTDAGHAS